MEFPAKNVDVMEFVAKNEQFPTQNGDDIESRRQKRAIPHTKFEMTRVKSIKKGPSRTKLIRESPREKIVMNTP